MNTQQEKAAKPHIHDLKTWPEYFQLVKLGVKRFELRKNDRDYKVNDMLRLREYDPVREEFTKSDPIDCRVKYILRGGKFGIKRGYVCMSIE